MLRWAWKTLLARRSGAAGGSLAIASAFVLVLFFDAIYQGEVERAVTYIRRMDADVWVMQRGVGGMHMASSFMYDSKADLVGLLPGVRSVTPILYTSALVTGRAGQLLTYAVGLGREGARAGPWGLAAGRTVERPGEVVIPAVMGSLTRTGLGDTVRIGGKRLVVVGLSTGTYSQVNSLTFMTMADLEDVISKTGSIGAYSYLLVDAEDGTDPAALAARIRASVEKVNALPQEDLIGNDVLMGNQMGVEIIRFMTIIAGVLATLMVGFTASSLVMRARRELAVAKALGMPPSVVLAGVAFQTGAVTLLGLLIALAIAATVVPLVPLVVPQLAPILFWRNAVKLGGIALVAAAAGALVPGYMVSRVDPATVFQR
jgi:ABC-type antimicrobial peptide transport system permease subunit